MICKTLLTLACILALWQSDVWSQKMTIRDGQWVEYKEPVDTTPYFKRIFVNMSLAQAYEKAAKENKKVMIYFTTRGCGYYQLMDRTIVPDSIMQRITANYIPFKNLSDSGGFFLEDKYKMKAFPSFLILDSTETILKKRIGYMTIPELNAFFDEPKK